MQLKCNALRSAWNRREGADMAIGICEGKPKTLNLTSIVVEIVHKTWLSSTVVEVFLWAFFIFGKQSPRTLSRTSKSRRAERGRAACERP